MKRKPRPLYLFVLLALAILVSPQAAPASAAPAGSTVETIVLIRHGEKTAHERGQLSCRGLNRALELPDVLIGKYGRPDYLFAPNPSDQIEGKDGSNAYSYIRPLMTIEPTAIKLGMPVNTQIGFQDIGELQTELTRPLYANSLIFVAWEHSNLDRFAKDVMKAYGDDPSVVPHWPKSDYDSIFVIRLVRSGGRAKATFTISKEGLNDKIGNQYPVLAGK